MEYLQVPEPAELKKIKLFFIIGRSRSGTTLLRAMLDMHPSMMVPVEGTFVLQLARKYCHINKWTLTFIDNFLYDIRKTWLFYDLKINVVGLRNYLTLHISDLDYPTVCKAVFMHTPVSSTKSGLLWIGDKNPSYSVHFNRIFRIFGDQCKYIFISRDYRDQFISLKKAGIEIPDITVSTKRWVYSYKSVARHRKTYPDLFHSLTYEGLVSNPETQLKEICRFLEVSFEPGMMQYNANPSMLNEKYHHRSLEGIHKGLLDPVNREKIGVWRSELGQRQVGMAEYIAGNTGRQAGYECSVVKKPVRFFFLTLPGSVLYYILQFAERLMIIAPFRVYVKLSNGAYLGMLWNKYLKKHGEK